MLQDRLPAKPSFYRYVMVLFILNCVAAAGEVLTTPLVKYNREQLVTFEESRFCANIALSFCPVVYLQH